MPVNLPTCLTWLRIFAIPLLLGLYYLPSGFLSSNCIDLIAMCIFIFAAITDWADGYLARKLNQTSDFGAFLDPVADKLLVATVLIILVDLGRLPMLVAVIIISREIAVSALREWAAKANIGRNTAVSILGKLKTATQMAALPMLFFHSTLWHIDLYALGSLLIWIAAALSLWSMIDYIKKAWSALKAHQKHLYTE